MKDYYKILNINFQASEKEIKKQYRKLAKIYHPDKNGGSKFYEDNFKLIVEAYETLSNDRKRNAYDSKYNLIHLILYHLEQLYLLKSMTKNVGLLKFQSHV